MSSESSLLTTAASDTSSSADSRYCSSRGGARGEATSKPARRRSYNLKARGVVISKAASSGGGNQKVLCTCKACKGQRLVSKSTCYRHLRVEAEIAEVDVKPEAPQWNAYTQRETLRMYQFLHLAAGIRLGFVQWWRLSILHNFFRSLQIRPWPKAGHEAIFEIALLQDTARSTETELECIIPHSLTGNTLFHLFFRTPVSHGTLVVLYAEDFNSEHRTTHRSDLQFFSPPLLYMFICLGVAGMDYIVPVFHCFSLSLELKRVAVESNLLHFHFHLLCSTQCCLYSSLNDHTSENPSLHDGCDACITEPAQ